MSSSAFPPRGRPPGRDLRAPTGNTKVNGTRASQKAHTLDRLTHTRVSNTHRQSPCGWGLVGLAWMRGLQRRASEVDLQHPLFVFPVQLGQESGSAVSAKEHSPELW